MFGLAAVLLILPLIFTGRYYLRVLTQMAFFTTFASAFGLLFGRTNQLFLCIAALAGLSAYTSGLLVSRLGIWHWPTIVIGAMLSSAVAAGLSYVSNVRRLGVVFVAIMTLAFQLIFENMVVGLGEPVLGAVVTSTVGAPEGQHLLPSALLAPHA